VSAALTGAGPGPGASPARGYWVLLAAALVLAFFVHPVAALALLAFTALQVVRPLDFPATYLMVVTGASFVNYTRGRLTFELSLLSVLMGFMLLTYTLRRDRRLVALPVSPLLEPLLPYLALTLFNFVRGVAAGNSLRYAGLELLAALALGSTILVANQFKQRDLKLALGWLWVTALGHSALGFYIYSILKVRTGSIYFTPIPGVVAVVMFNFALRARSTKSAALWVLAFLPLLLHQFLSFTRGYWLSIMVSMIFSIVVHAWRRPDWGVRLRRAGFLLSTLVGLGLLGAMVLAVVYGIRGLGELALSRLSSSTGTSYSFETSSNIVRLVEAAKVIGEILKAPIQGHGLGYSFTVREPIHLKLIEQWFCHENYLLVWVKQGLIGLALFVWTLFAAVRTGLKAWRHEDSFTQSWCVGAAAATVYVLVYNLVHFPLAEVNTTFTIALLWGGAMALTSKDWHVWTWGRASGAEAERP
jgi:O-antigen ligase